MDTVVIAFIAFIIGNISGFFLNMFISKKGLKLDSEARINLLILVVSLVWLISVLVDVVSATYETSPLIHGIMGAIVGFFFYKPAPKDK